MTEFHRRPVALLVEDDADVSDMYATCLSSVGFHVIVARSAAAAVASAMREQPNVIIADVRMSGERDGLQIALELRLDQRTATTPIIVLTGDAYPVHRQRALAAGCDAFLTKPCLPSLLAETARTLIAA